MDNKNISYYIENNTFKECNSICQTCDGPNDDNCLSCMNETLFLNNGTCLTECPNGTLMIKNNGQKNVKIMRHGY